MNTSIDINIHGPLKATSHNHGNFGVVKLGSTEDIVAPITLYLKPASAAQAVADAINAVYAEESMVEAVS